MIKGWHALSGPDGSSILTCAALYSLLMAIILRPTKIPRTFKTSSNPDLVHSEIGARADLRMDKVTFKH
jgi:hypothetical protein